MRWRVASAAPRCCRRARSRSCGRSAGGRPRRSGCRRRATCRARRSRGRHRDDHTRHALRDRHVDVVGFLAEVLVGVAQHHPEPALATPSSMPRTIDVKNGFSMSATITAQTSVAWRRSARAGPNGWYPSSATAASHARVRGRRRRRACRSRTLDTVAGETCAALATSSIVVARLDTRGEHTSLGLRS